MLPLLAQTYGGTVRRLFFDEGGELVRPARVERAIS
jgi:hypothetical protein